MLAKLTSVIMAMKTQVEQIVEGKTELNKQTVSMKREGICCEEMPAVDTYL